MNRWTSAGLLVAFVLLTAREARAQYMYLDSDVDGENTGADVLGATGETSCDVWLMTDRNRDGTTPECPWGTASGADAGPDIFTINSYEFILRASGGTVSWSGFVNQQPSMSTSFG